MPLLPSDLTTIGVSPVVMGYGILVEKHYVSKWSALPNLFTILFSVSSLTSVSQIAILGLIVYSFICMIGAWKGGKDVQTFMKLLGSKVTGGILFGLAVSESKLFGINPADTSQVLIAVIIPSAIAVAIGYLYSNKS